MKNRTLIVASLAATVVVSGCGTDMQPQGAATSAAVITAGCAQVMKTSGDPSVIAAANAARLPAGVTVDDVYTTDNTDDRSTLDVLVYLCGSTELRGDVLKDAATAVAQSIKAATGGRVGSLRVSNAANRDDPAMRVRCDNFQLYTWAPGVEAGAARLNWEE